MPDRPSPLAPEQIADALEGLRGWEGGPEGIHRTVEAATFPAAIDLVGRVAEVAEEMNHHPDIDIRWRRVTFTLSTHDAGGVTGLDIEQAARINALAAGT